MAEKLPIIFVEKQGNHSENPPKGIDVPIRRTLAQHGFTEGIWILKVRMVHARGNSSTYRGAHFKRITTYSNRVIDVVSQPGNADTAFPGDLVVPDCYDATEVLSKVRQIALLSPETDEEKASMSNAAQVDISAAIKRRDNDPIVSRRQVREQRTERIAKLLAKARNVDAVGAIIEPEIKNGLVPTNLLDKAIRRVLPDKQLSTLELGAARAMFVLAEDLLTSEGDHYSLTERGKLWIESLNQLRMKRESYNLQMVRSSLQELIEKRESSLNKFEKMVKAERANRKETIKRLKSQLEEIGQTETVNNMY